MALPTLTYPPDDYSYAAACLAEQHQEEGTLAHAFHQEAKAYQRTDRIRVKISSSASDREVKTAHCDAVNSYYAGLRAHMADWMQRYILAHGGKVDSWPDPLSSLVSTFEKLPGDKTAFDYFGADYTLVLPNATLGRRTPDPVYRNDYRYRAATPYSDLQKKKRDLGQETARPQKRKADTSLLVRILTLLGGLYCILAVLLILGEAFFGIGGPVIAMEESAGDNAWLAAGAFLLALPLHLYSFVLAIFSSLSNGLTILFTLILLGLCLLGAIFCLSIFRTYQGNVRSVARDWKESKEKYAKAEADRKAALQELENSPEMWEQAKREEEAEKVKKAELEAFAEEWHRAWFDWVCREKSSAD